MNDITTTTKHPVTHNTDGTITATVSIKLTREQWEAFERKFNTRHLACAIGPDSVQISDFVMFQIFGQLEGNP